MKQNTEQKAFSKIVNSDLKINKLFANCGLKDTSNKTRIETSQSGSAEARKLGSNF